MATSVLDIFSIISCIQCASCAVNDSPLAPCIAVMPQIQRQEKKPGQNTEAGLKRERPMNDATPQEVLHIHTEQRQKEVEQHLVLNIVRGPR